MKSKNILLIDDTDVVFNLLSQNIQSLDGYIIKLKYQAVEQSEGVMNFLPDLIFIYIDSINEKRGIDILKKIKPGGRVPVIIVFESENDLYINQALETNPSGIFIMPVHRAEVITLVKMQLQKRDLEKQLELLKEEKRDIGKNLLQSDNEETNKFGSLFDDSPIPVCDEDYSQVKLYFDELKKEGVVNFREYFEANPEEVKKCAALIKVNNINKEAVKFLNGAAAENYTYNLPELLLPESYGSFKEELIALAEGETHYEGEVSIRGSNGDTKVIIIKIKVTPGNENTLKQILISFFDISERKISEERIRASLKEKEILLKEIHHRVKNNLQIISSLLNLQSEYITDKTSKELFNDSLNRIRSMALIHERLYQSKNFSKINVPDYIKDVTNYLLRTYKSNQREVKINAEVENLSISIEVAIPLGLLINELVSNSLKYAFNNMSNGLISIKMNNIGNGGYKLVLKDNGIGIPDNIDFRNTKSLGLQLVNNLVEQLEGNIELDKTAGTRFTINFNINEK